MLAASCAATIRAAIILAATVGLVLSDACAWEVKLATILSPICWNLSIPASPLSAPAGEPSRSRFPPIPYAWHDLANSCSINFSSLIVISSGDLLIIHSRSGRSSIQSVHTSSGSCCRWEYRHRIISAALDPIPQSTHPSENWSSSSRP